MDPTNPSDRTKALDNLVRSLMREFFQTETSAARHCRREAERLGQAPPASTLREIASQAAGFLQELPALAKSHDLPASPGGSTVGALFSEARDKLADRVIRSERSYRGTMLGVRHGVDLVQALAYAARAASLAELEAFCSRWLAVRRPLVERLEQDLAWFAQQPVAAMLIARPLLGIRRGTRAAAQAV